MSMLDTHSFQNIQTGIPHLAAQNGLAEWHRIVASSDWDSLPALLTENVVFRNPAAIEPYHGKDTMVAILSAVFDVMQEFTYLRHFGRETGYVMEFSARVGAEIVFGVDLVEFNQEGKISDFMVMMRPASTVLVLAAEAGKRLAASHTPTA
ncbi:nuclear transport factor 2 family protein [Undibacterium curvum]|uniref:Nuclear transport factor 2 family protein n=1 Tax=Undibacterium curvum TaxID=2762294 RepID=A0ABR7A1C8_9BURK|nr:nuclear transport factor 2 family protein [Undibacterium curvum]MBC3930721.1 nuclear transport factor 2 family protein [Undibacterium curvum]